jgi:hypothetical protein
MYAYGVENITNPPPVLTTAQRAIISESPYVHSDTEDMAMMRTLLSSDAPASEIAVKLSPDSHRTLKALADLPDPIMASKAVYASRLMRSLDGDRLAREKLNDPRHAVRHAAARALGLTVPAPVKEKPKLPLAFAQKSAKRRMKMKRRGT